MIIVLKNYVQFFNLNNFQYYLIFLKEFLMAIMQKKKNYYSKLIFFFSKV